MHIVVVILVCASTFFAGLSIGLGYRSDQAVERGYAEICTNDKFDSVGECITNE